MDNQNPVLVVKNISKKYSLNGSKEPFWALKDVSFELGQGEILGIVGKNGAGKSTLLKILSDVIAPSSGTIKYSGNILSILDIGTGFHPDLTGLENIYLNASILGMRKSDTKKRLNDIVEFSGIGDFLYEPVKNYSNGMYLRLALSIALFMDSEILLLDEVVSVGDAEFRQKAISRIKELTKGGRSCIMISHDLPSISILCDKCMLIEKGEILYMGKSKEVIENYFDIVYKNLRSHHEILDDKKCILLNISTSKEAYFMNEPITVSVRFEKKTDEDLDVVLKIRNYNAPVLTDCEIYRPDYVSANFKPGMYDVTCIIPPNLFNAGAYFIDVIIGDKNTRLIEVKFAKKFIIRTGEWESQMKWNEENESIPFRPICDWKTIQI